MLFILTIFLFFILTSLLIITSYNHIISDKIHTITESYTATISSSLALLAENARETAQVVGLSAIKYSIFKYNQTLRNRVVNLMHVNSNIRMIYVGNEKYNYHYSFDDSGTVSQNLDNLSVSERLSSYDEDTLFAGIWITGDTLDFSADPSSLFFLQLIRNLNTIQPVGMILIEVDSSFLDEAINATAFETDTTIAFIKDQQLLYKNSEEFSDDTMVKIEKTTKT